MINSFEHKGLKKMFEDGNSRYIEADLRKRVALILFALDNATTTDELALPGFRLHELAGDLAGIWSISVNGNWRITFRFVEGNAEDVDLVDYH